MSGHGRPGDVKEYNNNNHKNTNMCEISMHINITKNKTSQK